MILLIDNYDSFTFNLKAYLEQLGKKVFVIRNDECTVEQIDLNAYEAVVISPGPGSPAEAGLSKELLPLVDGKLPVLGVCLGMQVMVEYFGGTVGRAVYPMHGKVSELDVDRHWLFEGIEGKIEVCRYHSLVTTALDHTDIEVIARSSLEEVMAIAHKRQPWVGLQFHPEAILTPFGLKMMSNWVNQFTLHEGNTTL